jgi:D-alanine-D-alanine ligase
MRGLPLVLVLHDEVAEAAPPEALDTLVQAHAVHAALKSAGLLVECLPVSLNLQQLRQQLLAAAPALVFNLVESPGGSDRLAPLVPALLEHMRIPYTGAGYAAMLRLTDKVAAKQWLRAGNIATPDWWSPTGVSGQQHASGPWIVKSVWEHASFGLDASSVVATLPEAQQKIAHCQAVHGGDWFAEQFVDGREFNVAVLATAAGPVVLPLAEIVFAGFPQNMPRIVDYAAKWEPESFAYEHTQRAFLDATADNQLATKLRAAALNTWQCCALAGYARVDFRVDECGQPWVVDVNPNPCLSPDAGFAAAAAVAGRDYQALIVELVESFSGFAAPERCAG